MNRPSPNQRDAERGRERRQELCTYLSEFYARERVAPTRDEMADALGIANKTVAKHILILIEEGLVEDMGGTRGLRLTQ